ncbi:hypothetical protein NVP1208B_47 [Vibrio phage 1.208.B._10N.222.52.A7]|nr:hypothetical protein NVP1208B_47 [Vibrio phage 1.208.B._10N.222.52.A7]
MTSKFVKAYTCTRAAPPLAFVGESVNVRQEGCRFVVTNVVTGHSNVLCKESLADHFEPFCTSTHLTNMGVV